LIFRNEDEVRTPQRASFAGWLGQRELAVVEFCEGNASRITIKLFALFFISHEVDFVGKSRSRAKDIAQLTRTSVRRAKTAAIRELAQDEKLAQWGYSRRGDKGVTHVFASDDQACIETKSNPCKGKIT
jgi:hypothetical protein